MCLRKKRRKEQGAGADHKGIKNQMSAITSTFYIKFGRLGSISVRFVKKKLAFNVKILSPLKPRRGSLQDHLI